MKKNIIIILTIIVLGCNRQTKPIRYLAYVSIDNSSKFIKYKIVNNSEDILFIPKSYSLRINKDSILFEAFDKSDLIHYNKFMIPEMKKVTPGSSILDGISVDFLDSLTIKRSNYYFRIFDEDFQVYLQKNKLETYYVNNFLDFEKEHSSIASALRK